MLLGTTFIFMSYENKKFTIRFLNKSKNSNQQRWSIFEKEAFAICYSLNKVEDLLGGIKFTIRMIT